MKCPKSDIDLEALPLITRHFQKLQFHNTQFNTTSSFIKSF